MGGMAHSSAYLLRSSDADASIVANQIQLQTLSCCFLECHVAAEHGRQYSYLSSGVQNNKKKWNNRRGNNYMKHIYINIYIVLYLYIYIHTITTKSGNLGHVFLPSQSCDQSLGPLWPKSHPLAPGEASQLGATEPLSQWLRCWRWSWWWSLSRMDPAVWKMQGFCWTWISLYFQILSETRV